MVGDCELKGNVMTNEYRKLNNHLCSACSDSYAGLLNRIADVILGLVTLGLWFLACCVRDKATCIDCGSRYTLPEAGISVALIKLLIFIISLMAIGHAFVSYVNV
jgi:hypothetical protein